jgi:hypothetical protein
MKKSARSAGRRDLLVFIFLLASALAAWRVAALDILVDARPGTLIVSQNSGDFRALGPTPLEPESHHGELTVVEEAGGLSTFPNVRLGVGSELTKKFYLDATAGGGILVTERFRSPLLSVEGSLQYKCRKNISFGPHLGVNYFSTPSWSGDADIEFSDSWGLMGGLEVDVGYDVLFVFCVDYYYIDPFKVTVHDPWRITNDELDFSGPAVQFGLRGKF